MRASCAALSPGAARSGVAPFGAGADPVGAPREFRAVARADRFFGEELPALRAWRFGPDEAKRIDHPVLLGVGERSGDLNRRRHDLLLEWLPSAQPFVLPGAGHLMHVENPRGMAEGLASFFGRHPIGARRAER